MIYVASRVHHAARWREARDKYGAPIISSWIDQDGPGDSTYGTLWPAVVEEIRQARALIFYAQPEDFPLKGAYVEVGMALAFGKPVYTVLPGVRLEERSMRPVGSWLCHPLVVHCSNLPEALDRIQGLVATDTEQSYPHQLTQASEGGAMDAREEILGGCLRDGQEHSGRHPQMPDCEIWEEAATPADAQGGQEAQPTRFWADFGSGDYSCSSCGLGMKEPCEHWKRILVDVPQAAAPPVALDVRTEIPLDLATLIEGACEQSQPVAEGAAKELPPLRERV